LLAELNNIIRNKNEEITDLKNLVYRHSDDVEKLFKPSKMEMCMTQIREMTAAKEQNKRELEELNGTTQVVVNMVDPPEEGVVSNNMLLERLRVTPQKISSYVSKTIKTYVEHILRLFRSYWPKAILEPLATGMSANCTEDKFKELIEEVKPVA
jgi:hypothetical protein